MQAKLHIAGATNWLGDTNIYALDEPLSDHTHLAVSVFPVENGEWQNAGVTVIGCDETGWAQSLDAIYQSYAVQPHAEVLNALGYTELIPAEEPTE